MMLKDLALALTLKLPLAVTVAELDRSAVVLLVLSALAVRAKLALISAGSASMRLIPTDTVVANAVIFASPVNTVVPVCVVVNDADNELAPLLILSADAVSDPNPVTTIFPIAVFCAVAVRTKLLDKVCNTCQYSYGSCTKQWTPYLTSCIAPSLCILPLNFIACHY
jgi:hypothetical protein